MKAIILAAGVGKRFKEVTDHRPKCLIEIQGKTLLELSLWSAREEFNDDIIIMDADVLFPVALLARLARSSHANCFLLDGSSENSGEEQMLLTRSGRVLNIVRGGSGDFDVVGESVGFLKVSRTDTPLLRSILEDFVAQGRDTIEHEEAFPVFLAQRVVGFERVDDLPWIEIDFPTDLEQAERDVLPQILALDQRLDSSNR
jgi:L-glutamine-phosphate cytidylyltransferase